VSPDPIPLLAAAILVIAFLYSSVGHAGHFPWRVFWPFAALAVPMAFVGGSLSLPTRAFEVLVGIALLLSAARFLARPGTDEVKGDPPRGTALALLGAAGVGGVAGSYLGSSRLPPVAIKRLLVLEDVTRPSRLLFSAWGVEWWATRWAWVGPLFWTALGLLIAWAQGGGLLRGVAYGILLYLSNTIHTLGHIGAGAVAGARMDAVVLTSTRDVDVYRGAKRDVPTRVRVLRSLGGPAANALVGVTALGLGAAAGEVSEVRAWLTASGLLNLAIAAWTLMPIPTMDGWILWRALLYRRRGG